MRTIGRRQLVLLAAVAVTAGCTAEDPVVSGGPDGPPGPTGSAGSGQSPSRTPRPTPAPSLAGSAASGALEAALAASATTLAERDGVPRGLRDRLELVAAGHRTHAVALASAQPTLRPTSPTSPGPSTAPPTKLPRLPADRAAAVRALSGQLRSAATGYGRSAQHGTGSTALLWGSLAVSARMAADAIGQTDQVSAPRTKPPAPLPQISDVAAGQQLLTQLHAIVWGYRTAIAALDGSRRERAALDLQARMRSRDTLVGWLTGRSATVPAAEAAYGLPVEPTSAAKAGTLIMIMESALLPFAGQWLASCDDRSRRSALAGLVASGRTSVFWGGPPRTWPGWPD